MRKNSVSLIYSFLYHDFLTKQQEPGIQTFSAYTPTNSKMLWWLLLYICFPFASVEGRRPKNTFSVKTIENLYLH